MSSVQKFVENADCRQIKGKCKKSALPVADSAQNLLACDDHYLTIFQIETCTAGEDIQTTRRVAMALDAVEIVLADHIIVADNDWTSMVQSGLYRSEECRLFR